MATYSLPWSNSMPAYGGALSDDEIRMIVAYIRTLTPKRHEIPEA